MCLRKVPGSLSGWHPISSWLRISPPGSPSSLPAPNAACETSLAGDGRASVAPAHCVSLSPLRSRVQAEAQFTSENWIWELHFSVRVFLSRKLLEGWARRPILLRNAPSLGWSTGLCQLRWRHIGRDVSGTSPSNCLHDPGSVPGYAIHPRTFSCWINPTGGKVGFSVPRAYFAQKLWKILSNLCGSGLQNKIGIMFKERPIGPVNWHCCREVLPKSTGTIPQHCAGLHWWGPGPCVLYVLCMFMWGNSLSQLQSCLSSVLPLT